MKYILPANAAAGLFRLFAQPIYTNAPLLNTFYTGISPTLAEWNSGTTYALNQYVYQDSVKRIFRSNMASNLNRNPTTVAKNNLNEDYYINLQADNGTNGGWTDYGATNDYNAVDEFLSSQSEGTAGSSLIYEFSFLKSTTISVFNAETQNLQIDIFNTLHPYYSGVDADYTTGDFVHKSDNKIYQFTAPSTWTYISDVTVMYTNIYPIVYRENIIGLFEWLTEPFKYKRDIVIRNLPFYFTGTYKIRLTFNNGAGKPKVGNIIIGKEYDLGATSYDTNNSFLSFSKFSRNENTGELYVKKGNSTKRVTIPLYVTSGRVEYVEQVLRDLDGQIVFFIGDDMDGRFGNLNVLGVIRDGNVSMKAFNSNTAYIEVEGIV